MKKFTKLIALMLVLCMFATLFLACNETEEPTEAPTNAPTEAPTNKPTSKPTSTPTSKPTSKPTADIVPEGFQLADFYYVEDYNGEDLYDSMIDIGQGSYMHVIKDTNEEEYEEFKEQLYPDGSYYPNKDNQYGGVIYYDFNKALTKEGIKQLCLIKNWCLVCDDFETWEFYEKDYVK